MCRTRTATEQKEGRVCSPKVTLSYRKKYTANIGIKKYKVNKINCQEFIGHFVVVCMLDTKSFSIYTQERASLGGYMGVPPCTSDRQAATEMEMEMEKETETETEMEMQMQMQQQQQQQINANVKATAKAKMQMQMQVPVTLQSIAAVVTILSVNSSVPSWLWELRLSTMSGTITVLVTTTVLAVSWKYGTEIAPPQ